MVNYHLVVLVHGLWGNPDHMEYIKTQLEQQIPKDKGDTKLVCYVTGSHAGFLTYDGIDVNGKRISDEIQAETMRLEQEKGNVTKFSMIGYSLGGLISRYAIGYLYSKGYFDSREPVNFTTFCTPHVGVMNPGTSWGTRIYNFIGSYYLAHSGAQMFLADGKKDRLPLLVWMSDPRSTFIKALKSFKHLSLYANVINDKRTAWYTASISAIDPFKSMINESASAYTLSFIDGYDPVVIDVDKPIQFKSDVNDNINKDKFTRGKNSARRKFKWVKVLLTAVVMAPFWLIYLVGNSIYQRIGTYTRVAIFNRDSGPGLSHLHEAFADHSKNDSLLHTIEHDISNTVSDQNEQFFESIFSAMNSDSYKNYHNTTKAVTSEVESSETLDLVNLKGKAHDFNLPLNKYHKTIIQNLNSLKWNKFPVLLRLTKQTHRAAIVRHDNPTFEEGKSVVGHFVNEVFNYAVD